MIVQPANSDSTHDIKVSVILFFSLFSRVCDLYIAVFGNNCLCFYIKYPPYWCMSEYNPKIKWCPINDSNITYNNFNDNLRIEWKLEYRKYLEYDLKQNNRVKLFFLLNSANVPLLLSTISVVDAKNGRWNKAGPATILCAKLKKWNTNGN